MDYHTNHLRYILAENVRKERQKRGWSQRELGREAGVDGTFIGRIEKQESAVSTDTLAMIAKALGLSAWMLLADSEETKRMALDRLLFGARVTDERAAEMLPPAPKVPDPAKQKARKRGQRKPKP